jgi:hypothetical protein
VKTPAELIEPAVAFQETVVLKVPVPLTMVTHWTVWLDWIVDGVQLMATPVTVEVLLLEPQAVAHIIIPTANKSPYRLFISVLL